MSNRKHLLIVLQNLQTEKFLPNWLLDQKNTAVVLDRMCKNLMKFLAPIQKTLRMKEKQRILRALITHVHPSKFRGLHHKQIYPVLGVV